ncbi:unnamed protein product [Closterium sp. NIES-53]
MVLGLKTLHRQIRKPKLLSPSLLSLLINPHHPFAYCRTASRSHDIRTYSPTPKLPLTSASVVPPHTSSFQERLGQSTAAAVRLTRHWFSGNRYYYWFASMATLARGRKAELQDGSAPLSPVSDSPPIILRLAPSSQPWTAEEDAVLLRHALRHGTRQWGRLVRGKQLARGNKACCNRFLFLKKKFIQKHDDGTLPAHRQLAASPSADQSQRHMWNRPDVAKQYGGLSLVECMQLFLPPGLRETLVPSDLSPEHAPEFNPAPAAPPEGDLMEPTGRRLGREHAGAAAGGGGGGGAGAQQSTAAVSSHQLAHILFPELHATDVRTMHPHPVHGGMKRPRNDDDTGFSTSAGAAHTSTCEGLSASQIQGTGAIDASVVRSLLLRAADSQSCQQQCESRPTIPTSWLLALLQQKQQQQLQQYEDQDQQEQLTSLFTQDPADSKATQSFQSLQSSSLAPAAHCSSINTPTLGSLPTLDWPLSFTPSLPSSFTPSFSPSVSHSLAPSLSPNYVSPFWPRPVHPARPLSSASQRPSSSLSPFTFRLAESSRVLHSAPPNSLSPSLHATIPPRTAPPTAPINSLASPPSSHCQSVAPFTPTSLITTETPRVPSAPSAIINPSPLHSNLSFPSFPSLSALQSALQTPPPKTPLTLSNPSQHHLFQRYPSPSPSLSNAASASVDCSPPSAQPSSSQLSSQRTVAPVESQQLRNAATPSAGEASAAPHPAAAATSASVCPVLPFLPVLAAEPTESLAQAAALPSPLYSAATDASPLSPSALTAEHLRPHKMPRTSRGVLPPAALEFARSFFSGLPGRDDYQRIENSDGQQTLERTCTSARECLHIAGEGLPSLGQSLLSDIVSAATAAPGVTATPDVTDSPAAAALAAAAEGVCQGEAFIWKDLIELEGGREVVLCGEEKRAGLAVDSCSELEDLFEENEQSGVARFGIGTIE